MRELVEKGDFASDVVRLQTAMADLPQFKETLHHHHCDGLYARQMFVPKGTVLVGKTHKKACLNFIIQGSAQVVSGEGKHHVEAPEVFVSPAGTKRAMVALEDLTWITVHPNPDNELDLGKLELELIV